MFCPACGKENPQHAKFCAQCGKSLTDELSYLDKQRMKEERERQKIQAVGPKLTKQERKVVEKMAAALNRELRGMLAAPIDYTLDLIDPDADLWRFSTSNGRQYIVRAEGSTSIASVGTVIEGTIPCTHVIKNRGGWRLNSAFFPLVVSPEYINNFDASKVYKRQTCWNQATALLNSDPVLESKLRDVPTSHERWTGRSVISIPDDRKNPFAATGQLVPQGDLTLAALIYIAEAGGGVAKCVKALARIAALIGTLRTGGEGYGPALGWEIMHDLRGDVYRGEVTERLQQGWPLLVRAHAVEKQAAKLREGFARRS